MLSHTPEDRLYALLFYQAEVPPTLFFLYRNIDRKTKWLIASRHLQDRSVNTTEQKDKTKTETLGCLHVSYDLHITYLH